MILKAPHRLLMALIVLAAVGLRALYFSPYAIHHPDEAFQYLEQAHRLVFGTGLVPWEYRLGMRSWLVPLLLAAPMRLGEALAPGSLLYIILARLAAALLALSSIFAVYAIGKRVSLNHGLVAMAVLALWYESVYFSVHVLTETLAVAVFLSAAALLPPGASRGRLILGGVLLVLSVILRFHYAPAIGVFVLLSFGKRRQDWAWLALGGVIGASISGAIDLAMGQWPFAWVFQNFYHNVVADKASEFGRLGPSAYAQMLWLRWQVAIVPILWLSVFGARRFPALAAAAAVNLVVHMLIGHKEYRFILFTNQIIIFLAAIGSVDVVERWRAGRADGTPTRATILLIVVGMWAGVSAILASSPLANPEGHRVEGGYELARKAMERRVCGVALLGENYWATAGQTFLHATPLYYILGRDTASETRQVALTSYAYNAVIMPANRLRLPAAYRAVDCRGDGEGRFCLAIRDGGCSHDTASDALFLQRIMEAHDR